MEPPYTRGTINSKCALEDGTGPSFLSSLCRGSGSGGGSRLLGRLLLLGSRGLLGGSSLLGRGLGGLCDTARLGLGKSSWLVDNRRGSSLLLSVSRAGSLIPMASQVGHSHQPSSWGQPSWGQRWKQPSWERPSWWQRPPSWRQASWPSPSWWSPSSQQQASSPWEQPPS